MPDFNRIKHSSVTRLFPGSSHFPPPTPSILLLSSAGVVLEMVACTASESSTPLPGHLPVSVEVDASIKLALFFSCCLSFVANGLSQELRRTDGKLFFLSYDGNIWAVDSENRNAQESKYLWSCDQPENPCMCAHMYVCVHEHTHMHARLAVYFRVCHNMT